MALNPNILLQLEHPNVMDSYNKGYDRGRKLASEDVSTQKSNVLSQAMSSPLQKGETYSQRLAPLGGLAEGMELDKNQAAISKEDMAAKKAEAEMNLQKVELEASANQSLLAAPPGTLSKQAVLQHFQGLVEQGTLGQEYLAKVHEKLATLPDDDAAIRSVAQGGVQAGMKAKDVLDKYLTDANARLQAETARSGQELTARGQDLTYGMNQQELELKRQGQEFNQEQDVAKYALDVEKQRLEREKHNQGTSPGTPGQRVRDANDVLSILDMAEPLLEGSTHSLVGSGYDMAAGAFGLGTEGGDKAAQLKALEGALISKMPKMSGPQSDKDVLLYKQMAGRIGDSTLPISTRKAAMDTIRTLNKQYSRGDLGAPTITEARLNEIAAKKGVSVETLKAYLAKKGKLQ